ncbi:hypothetical protein [Azospirillum sp. TSO22-1]|uniref:hypothetical protein n=1 Tax=Azospirillum sp. TSO22-1 TaxID=716789 RepID=UPI0011B83723|nr:hypothetical protein [Azospirillum sp. TSO22-1]
MSDSISSNREAADRRDLSKIPVFVSCATSLNAAQDLVKDYINEVLRGLYFEGRALGKSDYGIDPPLREVYAIARHCSGGIVLGFSQFRADSGIFKEGTEKQDEISKPAHFPSPWNNLEAGILYALGLPLLVIKENGVQGGIFDLGTSEIMVKEISVGSNFEKQKEEIKRMLYRWSAKVQEAYYSTGPFGFRK